MSSEPTVINYRSGQCRNDDKALSHTYAMMSDGELWPMCNNGWNRANGDRFSIFRGSPGTQGDCKTCKRRVEAKLPPITDPKEHPTRWL